MEGKGDIVWVLGGVGKGEERESGEGGKVVYGVGKVDWEGRDCRGVIFFLLFFY